VFACFNNSLPGSKCPITIGYEYNIYDLQGSNQASLFETRKCQVGATLSLAQFSLVQVVNFSWLAVPVGAVLVPLICYLFWHTANEEQLATPYFTQTIALTGVGMFIEMLAEPVYILGQNLQHHKLRYVGGVS
jgi:hypothetical protein